MNKNDIYKAIAAQAGRGEMAFPTSAQVAMKVVRALDDPDSSVDATARLVQAEPLLAARMVAMANSVVYNRSGREVTDVRTALARLGFTTARSVAMALVTRQLAGGPSTPPLKAISAQLWEHTAHVASLAHLIARRVTRVDAETALFAGILHEVAGFYLLSRCADYPGLVDEESAEWIEGGEAEVGRAVLQALAVPAPVLAAIAECWDGYLALPPSTLGHTLLLADQLAPVPSPLHGPGGQVGEAGVADNISMVIGEETLAEILAESADYVGSLTRALSF